MGTYNTAVNTGIVLNDATLQNPVTVTASGIITNTNTAGGDAVNGDNSAAWTLTNYGTISATLTSSNGINFYAGGLVINAAGGLIAGPNAVQIGGTAGTVLNAGTILSTQQYGVRLESGGTVSNLAGTSGSAQIIGGATGVQLLLAGGEVSNGASGSTAATISGSTYGVWSLNGATTVTNYGTIAGTESGILLAAGGSVTNGIGGVVTATNRGIRIGAGGGSVDNTGVIQAGTGGAVSLYNGGAVTNREGGTIAGGSGVYIDGQGSVVNLGSITGGGTSGFGVLFRTGGSVENGSTSVTDALIGSTLRGVQIYDAVGTVTNFATIAASITYASSVSLEAGGLVTNQSSGVIGGGGHGIVIGTISGTVVNFGTVTGTNSNGVVLGAGGTVINYASIHGASYGINVTAGTGIVDNSGTITAAGVGVRLANGTLTNSGSISGGSGTAVRFGGADDRLVLKAGYGFTGGIEGGLGSDTLELDGSLGALTVDYNLLGLGGFETALFGTGNNATLKIANASGTVGVTISGFDATTETIDLTGIGSNGQVTNHDSVNNRVTITGSLGVVTLQLDPSDGTVFATSPDSGGSGTNFTIACFCRGTRIRTPAGETPVEELAIGDRVMTLAGRERPIKWIGRRAYDPQFVRNNRNILPVRVAAGALAAGVPERDLYISPEHALYLGGLFLPARLLVNGVTIRQDGWSGNIEYFHIELDSHQVIFAEGAAAETFVAFGGRGMFHNGVEFAALYPGAEPPEWEPYEALMKTGMAGLPKMRAGLLARAERLGLVGRDPDLHLLIDGSIMHAQSVGSGVHRFAVPAGAGEVRIASRSVVPAETEVDSRDRRRVGVPLRRVVLFGADRRIEIGPDCPALRDGFHTDEGSHRWTDGNAALPAELFPAVPGTLTIEVQLAASELHYPIEIPAVTAACTGAVQAIAADRRRGSRHSSQPAIAMLSRFQAKPLRNAAR